MGEGKSEYLPQVSGICFYNVKLKGTHDILFRAEAERLAAERLLEEAKALIEDAKIRVDKDEIEVYLTNQKAKLF